MSIDLPVIKRVVDTRPLEVDDLIQCKVCAEGIANGKKAGIESTCPNVYIPAKEHKGKVIATVKGSEFVTVRYFDSYEPVKVLRRNLIRISQ